MRLFEDVWTIKGKTFVREYDTTANKSTKRETLHKPEYYKKDPLGEYRGFLDDVPLRKVQGSAYQVPDAYGERQAKYVAIRDDYFGKDLYNTNPRTWFFDIETKVELGGFPEPSKAEEEICLIQFFDTTTNEGYVLGLEEWKYENDYQYDFKVNYTKCDNEVHLLETFMDMFNEMDPLIIYAWNGNGFDYPYIFNRLKNLKIHNRLSNYGKSTLKEKNLDNGQTMYSIESSGHYWMDLLDIYKKFVFKNVPNYSLDTIGEIEAGIKKVNHDNYRKFDDFRLGNYHITNKETEQQKQTKLYKLAKALEDNPNHPKKDLIRKYIKEKSYSDFVHYGVQDFVVLKGIHDAQNFTQLMTTMAGQMGCTIDDTLGTLNAWDKYITNVIHKDKKIAPPKKDNKNPDVVGGYVRDPVTGKHKWILSSDVNSMYPLLGMASFNMSPETFIPKSEMPSDLRAVSDLLTTQDEEKILKLSDEQWNNIKAAGKKYNVAFGVGGAVFKKDTKGVIPTLVTDIYLGRKQAKKEMFKYEQQAIDSTNKEEKQMLSSKADMMNTKQMTAKIQINALYGALAAKYFSLFNESIAQAITGNGRFFIQLLANNIEEKLQSMIPDSNEYIIYGDTDSVYFQIDNFVEKYTKDKSITEKTKWSNAFYNKIIEAVVQDTIKDFSEKLCAFDSSWIGAEREVISDSGIFVAKKKYALRVRDLEGKVFKEDQPYIKVQGLEIIKGGTAPFSKKYLKDAIPVILDEDATGIKKWFDSVKEEFIKQDLDDIARTQGVSKVENPEWGTIKNGRKVSVPFGSRVCVVSNVYIEENNLKDLFTPIQPNDKVKILFLKQPNVLRSEAFAYTDRRFAEMFKDYIDYDETFEKHFVSSLDLMLKAVGVDLKHHTEELDEW